MNKLCASISQAIKGGTRNICINSTGRLKKKVHIYQKKLHISEKLEQLLHSNNFFFILEGLT